MKDHVVTLIISILTIVASSFTSVLVQRNFLSKAEENSFLLQLIPILISEDPRQNNMALLLLETTAPDKYQKIKDIMDKKVANTVSDFIERSEIFKPQLKKQEDKTQPPDEQSTIQKKTLEQYAKLRPDWKNIIDNKYFESVQPMDRKAYLNLLTTLDMGLTDKIMKKIIEEGAKSINNGNYFKAYVIGDWIVKNLDSKKNIELLGLIKTAPDKKDVEKIKLYFSKNVSGQLRRIYDFESTVAFSEKAPESEGESIDNANQKFLRELGSEDSFEKFITKPSPQKNKFEDMK